MNVTYSDKAKQGEGYSLLQHATACLEEITKRTRDPVKAEWDRTEDAKGQPVYTLRLSDWAGTVSADFTPEELRSPNDLQYLLLDIWGDLLRERSHKQIQKILGPEG